MVTIYHKTVKDNAPKSLAKFRPGSWIHAEKPSEQEIIQLTEELGIETDLIRDALDPYEVPRLEHEGDVTYLFTRVPHQEGTRVFTTPVLIALGPTFVLSVTSEPLPFLQRFAQGEKPFYTTQKTKFFLQLFTEINAVYNSFIITMSRRVRSSSGQLENITNRQIAQFVNYESILNDFLSALVPTNTSLNTLLHGRILRLYENDADLVEDLLLSNTQLTELAKSNLKTIVNIREAYSTIVTNNLNQVLKLLTSITIIMTVPMIISSFYGMNVTLPLSQSPYAFYGILGLTLIITLVLVATFIRNRWL